MSFYPQSLVTTAVRAARDKKAQDVVVLDIRGISPVCDYFVIMSGRSTTHVKAVADNVKKKLAREGYYPLRREGLKEGRWVLLDYGDVVVHIFIEEEREFYNLERLWGDARVIAVKEFTASGC